MIRPIYQRVYPIVNTSPSRRVFVQRPVIPTGVRMVKTPHRKMSVSPVRQQSNHKVIVIGKNQNDKKYFSNTNKINSLKCANHQQKQGKYKIQIDGHVITYCEICSTHLASQGFRVEKINQTNELISKFKSDHVKFQINEFKIKQRQFGIQFLNNPRMKQIRTFIQQTQQLKLQFSQNFALFQNIPRHYEEQAIMIEQFYDTMVLFINSLRQQFKSMLNQEKKHFCQLSEVMSTQLQQANLDLGNTLQDIVQNLNEIVIQVNEQNYRNSINLYFQKLSIYQGRINEQRMNLQEVTNIQQNQLKKTIKQFKLIVNNLIGLKQVNKQNNQYFKQTTSQQLPILKQINNQYKTKHIETIETRDPFRMLFQEDQNHPEQSPHFKMI